MTQINGDGDVEYQINGVSANEAQLNGETMWQGLEPPSKIHQWPVDSFSASTITDTVGSNDGVGNGGVSTLSTSSGVGGWVLEFDASNDGRVDFSMVPEITTTGSYTIALSVQPHAINSTPYTFLNHNHDSSDRLGMSVASDRGYCVAMYDGSFRGVVSSTSGAAGNDLVRIMYTYNNGSASLWIDGSLQSGTNTPLTGSPSRFRLGSRTDGDNDFDGYLDNVIVWGGPANTSFAQDDYTAQPWS